MKKEINTYGIKIDLKSLVAVSKETLDIPDPSRYRLEIAYDMNTYEVSYTLVSNNEWSRYYSSATMLVGYTNEFMNPQEIADSVHTAMLPHLDYLGYFDDYDSDETED